MQSLNIVTNVISFKKKICKIQVSKLLTRKTLVDVGKVGQILRTSISRCYYIHKIIKGFLGFSPDKKCSQMENAMVVLSYLRRRRRTATGPRVLSDWVECTGRHLAKVGRSVGHIQERAAKTKNSRSSRARRTNRKRTPESPGDTAAAKGSRRTICIQPPRPRPSRSRKTRHPSGWPTSASGPCTTGAQHGLPWLWPVDLTPQPRRP